MQEEVMSCPFLPVSVFLLCTGGQILAESVSQLEKTEGKGDCFGCDKRIWKKKIECLNISNRGKM